MVKQTKRITIIIIATLMVFFLIVISSAKIKIFSFIGGASDGFVDYFYERIYSKQLYSANKLLHKQNKELKAALYVTRLVEKENESLRDMLGLEEEVGGTLKYARVVLGPQTNTTQNFSIDRGSDFGIISGNPVLWSPNIFLGSVDESRPLFSTVKTIFDNSTNIPVQIGSGFVTALLVGGSEPVVELIPKDSTVKVGDAVFTAAGFGSTVPDLYIGEILEISSGKSEVFQEAIINTPYSIRDVRDVYVLITK